MTRLRPPGIIPMFFLLTALLLPATTAAGMDLQAMLDRALENDLRLKSLSGVLANTLLNIERARLAPGFQMKLSTGEVRLGYSFAPEAGDPPWTISVAPSGALVLGRKTETEVSVEVPLVLGFGDGTELGALPRMRIRQPLDKLGGGGKFTEAQERQNRYASEKARLEVLVRLGEVERLVLSQLSSLVNLEQAGKGLAHSLAEARESLETATKGRTFVPGGVQHRQLEFAITRLQRQGELSEKRRAQAWRQLERLVGGPVDALPEVLPEVGLALPAEGGVEWNPDAYLASLMVGLETARLEEEREPAEPKFFLGGAVRSEYNEVRDRTYTTIGGTLEGEFEDFALSAGVGGVMETGTLFVSAGLSWSLRDRKIESLNLEERENTLEVSRWNLAAAREAYLALREAVALDAAELDLRRQGLEEDRALADLRLTDARKALEQGFVTKKEVDALQWERDKLEYSARLLRLDSLLVRNRIEALVALNGKNKDGP